MKYNLPKIGLLLVLVVVFSFCFASNDVALAYDEPTLTLTPFDAVPGKCFSTTLTVAENSPIMDFEITLNYDPDLITLVSATENEDSLGTVVFNTETAGVISLTYSRTKNLTKSVPILNMEFKVDDNAGVGIYDSLVVDSAATKKADSLVNNVVTEVAFGVDFQKVEIHPTGDVDLSNKLDITDSTILRRYLVELETLTDYQLGLADTCYDGVVDITDATYIQRRLVNLKVVYGNRLNISFYDAEGILCATKSVLFGNDLTKLPAVPAKDGYESGQWSAVSDSYSAPSLTGIQSDMALYAVYTRTLPDSVAYYKQELTDKYYSGDMATNLSTDLDLISRIDYQGGEYATITWVSTNNYVLNSTTGKFTQPTYPTEFTLTAIITAYDSNGNIDVRDYIDFTYNPPSIYVTPTLEEMEKWLDEFFTYDGTYEIEGYSEGDHLVTYDLNLPKKITNSEVPNPNDTEYEVRIDWTGDGQVIKEITRTTASRTVDLVALVTFNGIPVKNKDGSGDGKVYIDDVHVTAINEIEVRNHIIEEIASHMGQTLTDGTALWNDDDLYDSNITWTTGSVELASVNNNVVSISDSTVNGSLLPLVANVSYNADGEAGNFTLEYTVKLSTDNELLVPGTNISTGLYYALKDDLGISGNLTTTVLASAQFVSLDLSKYVGGVSVDGGVYYITDLTGLSYCTNLRALNISGLQIEAGMSQIATLSKLEAFIAKDCGLDNLSDGGIGVLSNSADLKLLDLSDNSFTSLDSVLDESVCYGKLREVYLSGNQLEDISALSRAPIMTYLSLADNGLTSADIAQLANFPYLTYLSLANNQIDSVDALQNLVYLEELRLQHNQITDVKNLKKLVRLQALYLGNNNITSGVEFLDTLSELKVLYLNDNDIGSVSNLKSLSKLVSINVSNNPELNSLSVLANYTGTMEEIYAENCGLTSFSFIEGMSKLRVLMLSGNAVGYAATSDLLSSQLSTLSEMQVLTLSDKPLLDLSFLSGMPKLVRLDVANCGLTGAESDLLAVANLYKTLKVLDISNNDMRGSQAAIKNLRYLSNLVIFYADNICDSFDADAITKEMTGLKYISLEDCGISSLNWLSYLRELAYVDLADNPIEKIDFGYQLVKSISTLQYLYLDTTESCSFEKAYLNFDGNQIKELALEGVSVGSMQNLPYMEHLRYLNLSDTDLTELDGGDPDMVDAYSISRYDALKTLDVSGVQTDITPVEELSSLTTLYAVSTVNDQIFRKAGLNVLHDLQDCGVTSYLYSNDEVYDADAQREGGEILALLEDYSCAITVAANYIINDDNPVLQDTINDYDIAWSVSNSTNYAVVDNQIAVVSYDNIDDETLTLTATIEVYPDQSPVSRDFTIQTHILRVSDFISNEGTMPISTDGFGIIIPSEDVEDEISDTSVSEVLPTDESYEIEEREESEETEEMPITTEENEQGESVESAEENSPAMEETPVDEEEIADDAVDEMEELVCDGASEEESTEDNTVINEEETEASESDQGLLEEAVMGPEVSENTDSTEDDDSPDIMDSTDYIDVEEASEIDDPALVPIDVNNGEDNGEDNGDFETAEEAAVTEEVELPMWLDGAQTGEYTEVIPCLNYAISGLDDYLKRGAAFCYQISVQAASYEGFSVPVMPVVDDIRYTFSTTLSNGEIAAYTSVLQESGDGSYTILSEAPLNSTTTITTAIGHVIDEVFISDQTMQRSFEVVSQSYKVIYETNGGAVRATADGSVVTEQSMPEETVMFQSVSVSRNGYVFDGWYEDSDFNELFYDGTTDVTMPSRDITLYAKWTANSYQVKYDANGGEGTMSPSEFVYDESATLSVNSFARTCYEFIGWSCDKNATTATYTDGQEVQNICDDPDWNGTLYAVWDETTFTVTFNANGGNVSTAEKIVTYEAEYGELPTPAWTGHSFDGWYTQESGGVAVTSETTVSAKQNHTLYAHWTLKTYTVSFNANGGKVTPSSKTVTYNSTYGDLPTPTRTGYSFSGWYTAPSDGTNVTSSTTVTVDGSHALYAHWNVNSYTYTIKYVSSNGTDLGSSSATYQYGTSHTISAPSKSGYNTPAAQTITWDSTSKTITFYYSVIGQATSQSAASAWWWQSGSGGISYVATVEYQSRTSSSVQVRVVWVQSIKGAAYGYNQYFSSSIGGVSTGNVQIASTSTWPYYSSSGPWHTGSVTVASGWVTVPVSATATSVYVSTSWWDQRGASGSWAYTMAIPTY